MNIVQGTTLIHSGTEFTVMSVDTDNVNLTNGQKIPREFIKHIFTVK